MIDGNQDRPARWLIVKIVACLCAVCWAGLGTAAFMGVDGDMWVVIVFAAAVAGEGLCWSFAWALGVTLFEARRAFVAHVAAKLKDLAGGPR